MKIKWMNVSICLLLIIVFSGLPIMGDLAKQIQALIGTFCFGWFLGDVLGFVDNEH